MRQSRLLTALMLGLLLALAAALPADSLKAGFDVPVTQRQFLLLLARALGRDPSDASLDALLPESVSPSQQSDKLTREQAVVILMKAVGGRQPDSAPQA